MKKIASAIWEYCKATDKLLWLFCLSASAFSLVLLSSMQYNHAVEPGDISMPIQTIAVLLGIISALVVSAFDYHLLAKLWKLHVPLTVFLVLLTYTPLGITPSGTKNKAWLSLFGITTFQPSELLKISFILTFAL
ncbi:MAG TPA: FtsW/RodA/SpoVE family cell cycle protein, partial [Firmicutes bacterium]|nr:FtsW/RodA/SpoVE family cell cycle protein [Bacillota bacterium]